MLSRCLDSRPGRGKGEPAEERVGSNRKGDRGKSEIRVVHPSWTQGSREEKGRGDDLAVR